MRGGAGYDTRVEAAIDRWMPVRKAAYYRDLATKHFGAGAVGSCFTVAPSPAAVLRQVIAEHPSDFDHVDHRYELLAAGVDQGALLLQCRYILVRTPGTFGLVLASELDPGTAVVSVRTKVGSPCSLVAETCAVAIPTVEVATVVFGPDTDDHEVLWTMHPGYPIRPAEADRLEEGSSLTAREVLTSFGDCWLQLRVGVCVGPDATSRTT